MKKMFFVMTALITVAVSANASQSWPVSNNVETQVSKFPTEKLPVTTWSFF